MKKATAKKRAPRNRTMELSNTERQFYQNSILTLTRPVHEREVENRIIAQNLLEALDYLPA
ncbi:MAG: site-specific DNA-methyltransferase, partial [Chloroflexi bacterium]